MEIIDIVLLGHIPSFFLYFSSFKAADSNKCSINLDVGRIRTKVLWYQKQLSHNHCLIIEIAFVNEIILHQIIVSTLIK